MLSHLKGTLETKAEKYVVMDVGGVGFKVFVSPTTLEQLPAAGQRVALHTHLYVRQEAVEMYGFLTRPELLFFEILLSVSGVGPRVALGVLNVAPVNATAAAIAKGQAELLTKVSGVGNKVAQKIILELKDKITKLGFDTGETEFQDYEVIDALVSLGYTQAQARSATHSISKDITGVEKRIKEALKILGR